MIALLGTVGRIKSGLYICWFDIGCVSRKYKIPMAGYKVPGDVDKKVPEASFLYQSVSEISP